LTSIVEHVVSGSTIKVLIGNSVVAIHLTGVQCPSPKFEKSEKGEKRGDPKLGRDAKHFTEITLLHRDVSVILEGIDKSEHMFGSIILENKCFQEVLLSEGYGSLVEWNVGNSKFSGAMRKAEQEGIKKKKNF